MISVDREITDEQARELKRQWMRRGRVRRWLRLRWRRFVRWTVASPLAAFIVGGVAGAVVCKVLA